LRGFKGGFSYVDFSFAFDDDERCLCLAWLVLYCTGNVGHDTKIAMKRRRTLKRRMLS
jgi:hypothetical protein